MIILKNYEFLKDKVEAGRVDNSPPFALDGIALADQEKEPNFVYVFYIYKNCIWWAYAWANKFNKSFLNFHKKAIKYLSDFNLPILGTHKGNVFKNHSLYLKDLAGIPVYQFIKKGA